VTARKHRDAPLEAHVRIRYPHSADDDLAAGRVRSRAARQPRRPYRGTARRVTAGSSECSPAGSVHARVLKTPNWWQESQPSRSCSDRPCARSLSMPDRPRRCTGSIGHTWIERAPATPPATAAATVTAEPRPRDARRVGAAIVLGDRLDVLDVLVPVASLELVFDAEVWKRLLTPGLANGRAGAPLPPPRIRHPGTHCGSMVRPPAGVFFASSAYVVIKARSDPRTS
jgi:hypothetical protein